MCGNFSPSIGSPLDTLRLLLLVTMMIVFVEFKNLWSELTIPDDSDKSSIVSKFVNDSKFYLTYYGTSTVPETIRHNDVLSVVAPLPGGKGGFGNTIKSDGRNKVKRKADFSFCRDLQGHRLAAVNNALRLEFWNSDEEKAKRKELGSHYSVKNWFLGVPSWSDATSDKPQNKRKRPREGESHSSSTTSSSETPSMPGYVSLEDYTRDMYQYSVFGDERSGSGSMLELVRPALEHHLTHEREAEDRAAYQVNPRLREARWTDRDWIQPLLEIDSGDETLPPGISVQYLDEARARVTGIDLFSSCCVPGACIDFSSSSPVPSSHYFEVLVESEEGTLQVGWCDDEFPSELLGLQTSSANKIMGEGVLGVGDGESTHSLAFCSDGTFLWRNEPEEKEVDYLTEFVGEPQSLKPAETYQSNPWKSGDVIGCFLTKTSTEIEAKFSVNGAELPYSLKLPLARLGKKLFPAISIESRESVIINVRSMIQTKQ
jgi:Silencing defective 2 N-terminal ubiquitin domain/SPRY domain